MRSGLWPMSVERCLANDRRAFPKCSDHLIDWKGRLTLIGHKSDLIWWISTGGIYDFLALFRTVLVQQSGQTGRVEGPDGSRGKIEETNPTLLLRI